MTAEPERIHTAVIARADTPEDGTELHTDATDEQGHHVHVVVAAMSPFLAVLVRFARTYLQGLIGFLLLGIAAAPVAAGLGVVLPPGDFFAAVKAAAGLALAPAVISLLQNLVELLGKLDEKFPRLRA